MSYRTYLFDLDGTVLDTVELILSSHRHTHRAHFGQCPPDAVLVEAMGRTLAEIYSELAPSDTAAASMVATYRRYNEEHHDAMVTAYVGIAEVLHGLQARGAALAVVTSKRSDLALRGLRIAGLDAVFPLVVGADHVTRGKPNPEPVHTALDRLGAPASSAVMIGDSPHDLQAGRSAGVATVAVGWGPFAHATLRAAKPDHFVTAPEELLSLVPPNRGSRA